LSTKGDSSALITIHTGIFICEGKIMRVITWNMRRATATSGAWKIFTDLNPDVALLQEVSGIPNDISDLFDIKFCKATNKNGKPQHFGTAIFVKGKIIGELPLSSEYDWVNQELEFFKGNFVSCIVQPQNQEPVRVVSVYSPPWPVDKERLKAIDVSPVKLQLNPSVWGTEIIWSALKNIVSNNENWVVGGDYNSSETLDITWQDKNNVRFGIRSHGNREILDRMYDLGFKECLREYHGKIVPTYKHSNDKIDHQLDHLFVSNDLYSRMQTCTVGDQSIIFPNSLSDHLPIIADFKGVQSIPPYIPKFINSSKWAFAKTMSEIPHYYVVRDNLSETDKKIFDELDAFIRKNGYATKFYSKQYTYFNMGKYKYWVIENILNRALLEHRT
jgi:exonuclease III